MSDPDEIVDMFLKFPNGLSSSQKSDYERCSSRPSVLPRVKKRCLRRSERAESGAMRERVKERDDSSLVPARRAVLCCLVLAGCTTTSLRRTSRPQREKAA